MRLAWQLVAVVGGVGLLTPKVAKPRYYARDIRYRADELTCFRATQQFVATIVPLG